MHVRARLRADAIAALGGALSAPVTPIRMFPRNRDELPAVQVTTPSEEVERLADDTLARRITLAVLIDGMGTDVEDELDAIAEVVEATLLEGLPDADVTAAGSSFDPGNPGEGRPGRLTALFTALVLTDADNPQSN